MHQVGAQQLFHARFVVFAPGAAFFAERKPQHGALLVQRGLGVDGFGGFVGHGLGRWCLELAGAPIGPARLLQCRPIIGRLAAFEHALENDVRVVFAA